MCSPGLSTSLETVFEQLVFHLRPSPDYYIIISDPPGMFRTPKEYNYQTVKCNVDLLKVIQIGLTFADECGNRPEGVCTWQFNFAFDLVQDLYASLVSPFRRS